MIKKILGMFLALLTITVLGVGAYGATIYFQSTGILSQTYKGFGDETDVIAATKPMTILFLGVDTGSGSRSDKWEGNSDTMLLVTVNPITKKTTMMSLERDILTDIDNNGETLQAKLNAAYANGGARLAISTIQKLMNIHIDRYVMINMEGLVQLVNAVGGVTVNNTLGFPISIEEQEPEYTAVIEPGQQELNGDQALVYARMRYQDPEGDYGRQKRQREVIQKVIAKVLSLNSVSHYQQILRAVSDNMQTNIEISPTTIPQLLWYQDALKKIESQQLRGEDATLADGGSYQIVTSDHMLEMQNILRESLGLETLTSVETNAVLYETLYGGGSAPANAYTDSSTTNVNSNGTTTVSGYTDSQIYIQPQSDYQSSQQIVYSTGETNQVLNSGQVVPQDTTVSSGQ